MRSATRDLIANSKKGDAKAFRELSLMFDERVFSYLSARLPGRDEALDVLQNVLLELWRALPGFTYSSDEEFFGFVFVIARRQLYRSWGKKEELSIEELDEGEMPREFSNHERAADIGAAVKELDDTSQEIVYLKHWSRYSFKEIGDMLGMEEGAVRVRHHRALKKLADLLKDYE